MAPQTEVISSWSYSLTFRNLSCPKKKFRYPLLTVVWELVLHQGRIQIQPFFSLLMAAAYLLYRLSTVYRIKHGGGASGERWENPPPMLVTTGPYAFSRNPVYVGHALFLIGLALLLKSLFVARCSATNTGWPNYSGRRNLNGKAESSVGCQASSDTAGGVQRSIIDDLVDRGTCGRSEVLR